MIVYIAVIVSFLMESVITNIVNINSILLPLFLLTSLVIIYPYCKNNAVFISLCTICGLFYDISIDSSFINTMSYSFVSLIIIFLYNYLKYNVYSASFINLVSIVFLRIISYLLFLLVSIMKFNINNLFVSIYSSILINLIYGIILYIIINLIAKIFNIKSY